jgi:hypothetical protein
MKKNALLFFLCLLLPGYLFSQQEGINNQKGSIEKINMDFTIKNMNNMNNKADYSTPIYQKATVEKKSVFLAGLFSAFVPGTGELYTENYWQSAFFMGVEVASWIVNIKYNKKGDDQTAFFEGYANQHWSVVRYANWVEKNIENIVPDATDVADCKALFKSLYKSGTNPWDQVDWATLNEIEKIIGSGGGKGQAFSHSLPKYGEQQYFELIGKYPQFSQGWDDSDQNTTGDFYDRVTANFKYYASERGKANDFYSTAETFASIIVINHVISAIDAVLMAHFFNNAHLSVSYNGDISPTGKIGLQPNINLCINF